MATICSKGDKSMIAWIKNLLTPTAVVTAGDLQRARLAYNAKEDEINKLKGYSSFFCPLIKEGGNVGDESIHNSVLNRAIRGRIIALRKEQEEILV
jgi:hypothetical protein